MSEAVAREKRYVEIIADTDVDGNIMPVAIIWEDGKRYDIDLVIETRLASSTKTGGSGMRFTVRVGNSTKYLFYEGPRWFVEAKVPQVV